MNVSRCARCTIAAASFADQRIQGPAIHFNDTYDQFDPVFGDAYATSSGSSSFPVAAGATSSSAPQAGHVPYNGMPQDFADHADHGASPALDHLASQGHWRGSSFPSLTDGDTRSPSSGPGNPGASDFMEYDWVYEPLAFAIAGARRRAVSPPTASFGVYDPNYDTFGPDFDAHFMPPGTNAAHGMSLIYLTDQ